MVSIFYKKQPAEKKYKHCLSLLHKRINSLVAIPTDSHLHLNLKKHEQAIINHSKNLFVSQTFSSTLFHAKLNGLPLPDDCQSLSTFPKNKQSKRPNPLSCICTQTLEKSLCHKKTHFQNATEMSSLNGQATVVIMPVT